ncbi:type II toxin-antitoxin system VapC family toxin [Cyanobacterium aponinum]|uniref:type II toxin-antitoxin system VapC family toxin n=1 Tax=Cyanobacterium aponinum TaxID=379064 RepID=UPI000C12BB3C|nr:PIN domain-containing protein [Cyanobacterium aponinum]PHV64318.1 VapC toxin family PIN domain ribonuclease [Cyanobacterium aponinum IPPAS B-1201]
MAKRLKVLADTSGMISLLDASDKHHPSVIEVIKNYDIIIPSTIIPEVDYLATKYLGESAFAIFIEDLFNGYFEYISVNIDDLKRAYIIMEKYQDIYLEIVDTSIVALAEKYEIRKILTLDRRHFSLIKPNKMEYIELLP